MTGYLNLPRFCTAAFLCNRKLRSYYTKTLRGDAHCGVQCRCRKRPPQAQECALAHSLLLEYACGDRLKSVKSPFEIVKNSEKIVKI